MNFDQENNNDDIFDVECYTMTPVQQFYYGKNIFITGGTGFVGKALLEKLFRCCPGIRKIFLLVRPKKSLSPCERIEKVLKSQVFVRVQKDMQNLKELIHIIEGDIEMPQLGLTEIDSKVLINEVNVIFHCGARPAFADPLKVAASANLLGTLSVMEFASKVKNLEVIIHTSTLFIQGTPKRTAPEYVLKSSINPKHLLNALEWMSDETLDLVTPAVTHGAEANYLVTKTMAENIIDSDFKHLPIAIVRPAVIVPSYKEPYVGWADSIQGIQGLALAAGKGFLRCVFIYPGHKVLVVPVDIVVNAILTTAWYKAVNRPKDLFIVNAVPDQSTLLTIDDVFKYVYNLKDKYPLVNIYRCPDFTVYANKFAYYIHALFDQYIPAIIGDTFLFVFTGKPIMIRLYKRINAVLNVYIETLKEPWTYELKNYDAIENALSKEDKQVK